MINTLYARHVAVRYVIIILFAKKRFMATGFSYVVYASST